MTSTLTRPGLAFVPPTVNALLHSRRSLAQTEPGLRTRGEIEASICAGIIRFERDYLGRGPKQIRAHVIGDLLLVRLSGILTLSELQLVNATDAEKGCTLVKQMRTHLITTARPIMETMVEAVTGVKVVGMLFDISISIDEEFILFTLAEAPNVRDSLKR